MSGVQASQAEWVRGIRGSLGLSQSQLASMLGVSPRAIQSYEQGWRAVPQPMATHLMTVLAVHRGHPEQAAPCWTLTGCPDERRSRCAAFLIGRGRFCWLLAGGSCAEGRGRGRAKGARPCASCTVFRTLVDGPSRPNTAAAGPSPRASRQEEKQ